MSMASAIARASYLDALGDCGSTGDGVDVRPGEGKLSRLLEWDMDGTSSLADTAVLNAGGWTG